MGQAFFYGSISKLILQYLKPLYICKRLYNNKLTKNAMETAKTNIIGMYLNRYLWTDVHPIGKVIALKGKQTAVVQRVQVIENSNETKMDFHVGGFSAHCSNNYSQSWKFEETAETFTVRLSKKFLKRVQIEDASRYFYDFNF